MVEFQFPYSQARRDEDEDGDDHDSECACMCRSSRCPLCVCRSFCLFFDLSDVCLTGIQLSPDLDDHDHDHECVWSCCSSLLSSMYVCRSVCLSVLRVSDVWPVSC